MYIYVTRKALRMRKLSRKNRIIIILITVIAALLIVIGIYKYNNIRVFNNSQYNELYKNLEVDAESFDSQDDLRNYITDWGEKYNVNYKVDNAGNIIFSHKATARKKKVSPTVVVINYNYENAVGNRRSLASAFMVAATEMNSAKKTVIFINNENNDGSAYSALDPALIPSNAKVIYLDYGSKPYVSTRSFCQKDEQVIIDAAREDITCDTAIKINISGVKSDVIDAGISKHVNPINLFSTVLTRLKSKSTICQLADFQVENKGYMYPTGVTATILVNSYAVDSLTKYLDKRIEAFNKALEDDNPLCNYSYEILDNNSEDYPVDAYNKNTFDTLTTALYALKNGTYRYDESDDILDGYNEDSIYGISCIRQITSDDHTINIDVTSQAINENIMQQLNQDTAAAAELAGCRVVTMGELPGYDNNKDGLLNTLKSTYFKVSDLSGGDMRIESTYDTYFTPMTYLARINDKLDIVHVKESSKSTAVLTNMLLCYIKTKGNFLSL